VALTIVGYALLFLSGLSVCLFCWLTYSSIAHAARARLEGDRLGPRPDDLTGRFIRAGSA
jgi:hypothetical protein